MSQRSKSSGGEVGIHTEKSSSVEMNSPEKRGGMSYTTAGYFLVAQMAGAGFLALPAAFNNTGWLGFPMLILFCVWIGFSGVRLGNCWVILEERWPEYRKTVRQPYMEMAYRSFGKIGRIVILISILFTLIGSTIVYLILISQFLHALAPDVSMCVFIVVMAVIFIPFTWLGTPNDFWQASVLAVFATIIACLVIFIQLLVDQGTYYEPENPSYPNPTIKSFSLGFGAILFSFGGAAVFPTIQNDMADRRQFWKSVVIGFFVILCMYLPVATTGYALLGSEVPGNILLYRGNNLTLAVKLAIGFEIINLFGTYLIAFNPICQISEEMFDIPRKFGWKRITFRTSIILLELIIALALPDFGLILNLIGGSTNTLTSFLAPCLMYIKLVDDQSNPNWTKRTIPTWERILLYEISFVALVGGISATGSAIYDIINAEFSDSCLSNFAQT